MPFLREKRHLLMASGGAAPTYSISGTVYDADGTTAVSGATVEIGAASTTSAANGTYSITGLAAGTNGSLTCTKTGYSWTAKTISAMNGNLTSQNYTNAWWATGGIGGICLAAYNAVGAASQAESYVNLAHPGTNDLFAGNSPTWDTLTGWGWSAGKYLRTGITTGYKAHFMALSNLTRAGSHSTGGYYVGANDNYLVQLGAASSIPYYGGQFSGIVNSATALTVGLSNYKSFIDGLPGNQKAATGTFNNLEFYVGAYNSGGSAQESIVGNILAVAIYSDNLTDGQMLAVHNAPRP